MTRRASPTRKSSRSDNRATTRLAIFEHDAHELTRLRDLFDSQPGYEVVAASGDVETVAQGILAHRTQAALVSLENPAETLVLISTARANGLATKFLFLCDELLRQALTGCEWLASRQVDGADLCRLVERMITEAEPTPAFNRGGVTIGSPLPTGKLTPREAEVYRRLVGGRTNKEIAGLLKITEGTVKMHVHNILRKLEVASRLELVASAHRRSDS